ncbi:MAG: hypothetical protein Q9187_001919 [Circinaria calcarea]
MASKHVSLTDSLLILMSFQGVSAFALPQNHVVARSASLTSDITSSVPPTAISTTQVPHTSTNLPPGTIGSIPTSLETEGNPASQPFATTTVTSPTARFTPEVAMPSITASAISKPQVLVAGAEGPVDAFQPVGTGPPPNQIQSRGDHPAPRKGIAPQSRPLQTNKFYANLFLGGQTNGVWTHPYSVSWSHGSGNAQSWGLSVFQVNAEQRAYGPPNTRIPGSPVSYFINPLGIQSLILSAVELGSSTVLTTDTHEASSVNANLQPQAGSGSSIKFPLVQGMGFVTGIYTNLQPAIQSSVFFRNVVSGGSPRTGVFKYTITLEDNSAWLLYATPRNGQDPRLSLATNTLLRGPTGWSGTIQVAKNPSGSSGESTFDRSAGVYATTARVSGSVNGATGTYAISWNKAGVTSAPLIMFALPHHVQSFDSGTRSAVTSIKLQTTTKGMATAVVGDSWTLVESSLPTDMGFAPWTPSSRSANSLSPAAMSAITNAGSSEVKQDMGAQSNLNSMYYSGKALSKFATIVYTLRDLANQPNLASQGLAQLKVAFARFATNQQIFPLVYDTAWKGVVSTASYANGDSGADFGNSFYNDHHFHYGYFIHAAAIIAYLDPSWLNQNRDWVNTLVRDVANPSTQDNYFPVSRSFDWYHGHSWAKGLFDSGDSKDEESSSEDAMFAYSMKMWGRVIGDASMEARGNLMLSVVARSLQNYHLLQSDNVNQPANFIGNKVTGIQFVTEEWNTYFADNAVAAARNVAGGWKGILYANLAIIDPRASFNFFNQANFDSSWLDGGASRTWYLAYAAGMLKVI